MANKFIIKHGFHSKGDSQITGSLNTSGTLIASVVSASIISGSFVGDGSNLTGVTGGETNTTSNTGSGDGLFVEKVSSDLRFKTLIGGTGISVTTSSNEVTLKEQSIVFDETKLYFSKDTTVTSITIGTNSGSNYSVTYPVNLLEATANGSSNVRVQLKGGSVIVANSLVTSSIYTSDTLVVTSSQATVISELNTLFANPVGQDIPTISGSTTITLVSGSSLSYTLTGSDIVAHSWEDLPTGVIIVTGDPRTIIGGSLLDTGSYSFKVRGTNYYGEVTASMTLNVTGSA
tara:strand:+ start:9 stop:875 length:867 start_codon:yes stop_codon:yes gene_type:complete